ncbi:MAG: putative ABC transporter permease [Lachnospiraceae bacterium]|nr:putative ABC transporter permease [Lachnospiraceae bacterium]
MWDFHILGVSFYYITGYFIIFSVIGWLWESTYVSVCERRIVNRGFVTGPVCTIYGCGGLIMYLCLKVFENNLFLVYFGGLILATVLEYITASVMEAIFHTSWWDYTDKRFNIKGRICLQASLLWGAAAVAEFMFVIPLCNSFIALYSKNNGETAYTVCFVIYIIDFTVSSIAAADVANTISKMENMLDEFAETLRNSRVYSTGEELINRLGAIRRNIISADYIKRYSKRIEIVQAVWADRLSQLGLTEKDMDIASKLHAASDRFEEISKKARLKLCENRIIKAYPKIKSQRRFKEYLERSNKQ